MRPRDETSLVKSPDCDPLKRLAPRVNFDVDPRRKNADMGYQQRATLAQSPEERRALYREYLWSPEWQAKKRDALERAGWRCQLCNSPEDLDVHHRTYERIFNEPPQDLTVLCRLCHNRFHGNDGGALDMLHRLRQDYAKSEERAYRAQIALNQDANAKAAKWRAKEREKRENAAARRKAERDRKRRSKVKKTGTRTGSVEYSPARKKRMDAAKARQEKRWAQKSSGVVVRHVDPAEIEAALRDGRRV